MAKQRMIQVSLKDATIPHEVFCRYGGAKVLLRPASPGTGLIAGKTVRAVLESAGIKDILSKSLGSNNPSNVVRPPWRDSNGCVCTRTFIATADWKSRNALPQSQPMHR